MAWFRAVGEQPIMKVARILTVFAIVIMLGKTNRSYADPAEVLPKGVFLFQSTYYHYLDIHHVYDDDGNIVPLGAQFNAELTSGVFPDLAAFDLLIPGGANLGRTNVDVTNKYNWFEFLLAYGLTDKVTLGMKIYYNHTKVKVNPNLNTDEANVGKNATINSLYPLNPPPGFEVPGKTVPLTTADVQSLLGKGLDINDDGKIDIPGYGYDKLEDWTGSSLGDIEVGAKYRFYTCKNWRFSLGGAVAFPTGETDDPDNLIDVEPGSGNFDLLFDLYTDYLGIKDLLLSASVEYRLQLPDSATVRVPVAVGDILTPYKENVDRNLGDSIDFELSGIYSFTPSFFGALEYDYVHKFADSIDGSKGLAYDALEFGTVSDSHVGIVRLGYTTLPLFLKKKFPIPISTFVSYRNRFAGRNATKSQYISLDLAVLF